MTLLPTGTPSRPVSMPGMSGDDGTSMPRPVGAPRDHEESKILPVCAPARDGQMTATYWVTTSWPLATGGPDPLISVLTTSLLGGADEGTLTVGALPAFAVTVGRPAPPSDMWVPEADEVPV